MAALLFAPKALVVYADATYFDWRLLQVVHNILGASPLIHYNLRKAGQKKLATLEQPSIFRAWVRVIMKEGRKRQSRETCKQLGLPVVRILRIRIGSLRLGNLKPGQWRFLTTQEINELKGREMGRKNSRP